MSSGRGGKVRQPVRVANPRSAVRPTAATLDATVRQVGTETAELSRSDMWHLHLPSRRHLSGHGRSARPANAPEVTQSPHGGAAVVKERGVTAQCTGDGGAQRPGKFCTVRARRTHAADGRAGRAAL